MSADERSRKGPVEAPVNPPKVKMCQPFAACLNAIRDIARFGTDKGRRSTGHDQEASGVFRSNQVLPIRALKRRDLFGECKTSVGLFSWSRKKVDSSPEFVNTVRVHRDDSFWGLLSTALINPELAPRCGTKNRGETRKINPRIDARPMTRPTPLEHVTTSFHLSNRPELTDQTAHITQIMHGFVSQDRRVGQQAMREGSAAPPKSEGELCQGKSSLGGLSDDRRKDRMNL